MATPDAVWRVEVLYTRSCEVFRVRRRAVIDAHGGAGWAPVGQIRFTLAEVAAELGDAFAQLGEV
jgi:hypothetical protein